MDKTSFPAHPQITRSLRYAAQYRQDTPALIEDHRTLGWCELLDRVQRIAGAFKAMGVQSGSRVLLLSANCGAFVEVVYATLWAGAVSVPVNTRLSASELVAWIEDSEPVLIACSEEHLEVTQRALSVLPAHIPVVLIGETDADGVPVQTLDSLASSGQKIDDHASGGESLALICFTGGTTGRSKGVMLSHQNIVLNCLNVMPEFGLRFGSRYLHASPMFHALAVAGLFGTTMAGGTHYFLRRFSADGLLASIKGHAITHTAMVPTMIGSVVNEALDQGTAAKSLQAVLYGGSSMPERVARQARDALPNTRLLQGYGLTETSPTLTLLTMEDHLRQDDKAKRLRSAGQPVAGVDVEIHDEEGREVARGELGEICARGPTIFSGYWRLSETTAAAFRNGWFRTGDVGYKDEDGFVYVVDRIKDMIISGGENIYSAEVENVIYLHSSVENCAVIGLPDATWGEAVHAVVRRRPGEKLDEEELRAHCRSHLPSFKIPKSFEFAAQMPISGAGKILKAQLRKDVLARQKVISSTE